MRRLLVLDSSYALEAIRARALEDSVLCRDLDGFFDHVWTVHPFATLVTSTEWASRYGQPETHELAPAHTFIEGKIGRFQSLHRISSINFLVGQVLLFIYLSRLIKKECISVIRVGSPLYLGLFGWALSRWCRIPFVVRIGGNHDKIYETTRQPMEKRLFLHRRIEKIVERFVFRRADLIAGANQDNLDFALKNGARPEFATLFRYGNLIDKRHFVAPSERTGGECLLSQIDVNPHCFILYVGRLEPVKHPDEVVRVLAEVQKRGYAIKAVIAGDGNLKSELIELAAELRVEDKTVFVGNVDQDWLSKIIPFASAVISPHTGRALSEAALGGVPIVAYDIDWQGELIQNGITGELIPYLDRSGMVDSLERFLKDSDYARRMGDAVRKRGIEMMDPIALNQHERDQYRAVIERFNNKPLNDHPDGAIRQ